MALALARFVAIVLAVIGTALLIYHTMYANWLEAELSVVGILGAVCALIVLEDAT